jgi:hypothetical protein
MIDKLNNFGLNLFHLATELALVCSVFSFVQLNRNPIVFETSTNEYVLLKVQIFWQNELPKTDLNVQFI